MKNLKEPFLIESSSKIFDYHSKTLGTMCKANRIHTKNKTKNITIAYTKDGIEKNKEKY